MLGFVRRLVLLFLVPVVATAAEPTGSVQLHDVTVVTQPSGTTIQIKTSNPTTYHAEFIDSPARLVLDLDRTEFAWRTGPLDIGVAPLKQVRGSQYRKDVARVVIEFSRRAGYAVTEEPDGLAVVVPSTPSSAAARPVAGDDPPGPAPTARPRPAAVGVSAALVKETAAAPPTPPAPSVATPAPPRVAQAPAPPRPGPGAPATPAPAPAPPAGTGRLISLDFKDADVVNLLRILAAESGKNVVISDDVKGKMSITLRNVPWDQALDVIMEARGLEKIERGNVLRLVTREQLARERESTGRLEETRIKAEQTKATAEAEIRAKAADASLKEQQAEQQRFATQNAIADQLARGPLREETIRLAYADPVVLAKTLQGLLGIPPTGLLPVTAVTGGTPPPAGPPFSALYGPQPPPPIEPSPAADVLAKGITIQAYPPTNSIFIRHYEKDLERIKKLILEKFDVELPQIKIEARLNELNRVDLFDIGIQWGGAAVGRDNQNVLVGQGTATAPAGVPGTSPTVSPFGPVGAGRRLPFTGFLPVSALTGLPLGGNLVNLPALQPGGNAPAAAIGFGIIGTRFSLNLALQALEFQSKTRNLSRPEIVTVENGKAQISLGSQIPYATVSSAGTQVQFVDAVLKLEVTPTVIREPDGTTKIKMTVSVDDNSQQGTVPSGVSGGSLPVINKRHAETQVLVKEGESLVIGGIAQRNELETVRKVPLLGDIPVLGWLFKAKTTQVDPNRELVVFITPSLLRATQSGPRPPAPAPR
jgi:type IV pilus assembly protein PilQ